MFNTAENMKADRAKEVGIVDEVVTNIKEGHERIREICKSIHGCAMSAHMIKQTMLACSGQPLTEPVMFNTAKLCAQNLSSYEAKEGRKCEISGSKKPWETLELSPLY